MRPVLSLDELAAHSGRTSELSNEALAADSSEMRRPRTASSRTPRLRGCSRVRTATAARFSKPRSARSRWTRRLAKLGVTPGWLYRRGRDLGLATKLSDGTVRFSNVAVEAYIRERTVSARPSASRPSAPKSRDLTD